MIGNLKKRQKKNQENEVITHDKAKIAAQK